MLRRRTLAPTKSADMIKEYLDIINSKQDQQGKAKRYDIYRRAGSEAQTDRIIKYLKANVLIEGNDQDGYRKTKRGEDLHEILKKRELVGILTQDLKSDRIRPW